MSEDATNTGPVRTTSVLTPAAARALAEAEARRQAAASASKSTAKEIGGRSGPDPVRFGDWERGGLASDF